MLSVYSFETECMAISIHFTHVGSYLYCMTWCHLGILSILLHHYVVYFRFLSGSVSPHHMSLNMMSMISKRPKYNQLKNNSVTSSIKFSSFLPHLGNHLCCRMWWRLMILSIFVRR